MQPTENLRIDSIRPVATPALIQAELPITEAASQLVSQTRGEVQRILSGEDDRLLVVVGPCSIHDPQAAIDYAEHLKPLREALSDDLLILMRVYFEKPRTTVGWKGLINDPDLDESFRINHGLRTARQLLIDLNDMGVPAGVEFLDILTPQYVADLVSWGAIGARTTESQVHREMVSGLSCPVGFKNGTDGSVKIAADAVMSAQHPHHFLSMTKEGMMGIFNTKGNPDTHVILRGGASGPNYDADAVGAAARLIEDAGLAPRVMIDFSHANSRKQHRLQMEVGRDVGRQISGGDQRIVGVMIESHLVEGNQKIGPRENLTYGQSITDACLGWDDSDGLLRDLAGSVHARRTRGRQASA
ncbi:3-deoxy-7-phosphoheptulonate synthase [uncultured Abyssibacter sp.]|uniref:3-deoxy-7-phosphoheptulonate synthase n=1 Tax=uncultured Abyssibacter sp. TaxID=2320202 RepID=UPI0032B1DEEB